VEARAGLVEGEPAQRTDLIDGSKGIEGRAETLPEVVSHRLQDNSAGITHTHGTQHVE
jgi:hypothetical protein